MPSQVALINNSGGVLCCGNLVADILVQPVEEPGWGKTTWVEHIEIGIGGNGANTSYTLAKLGRPVRLLSSVGDDAFGRAMLVKLQAAGVDTTYVECSDTAPTPTSVVLVHLDGKRALLHRPGSSRDAFARGIELTDELVAGISHLHLANIFSLKLFQDHARDLLLQARKRGLWTSMDTGWDPRGLWMETIKPCLPLTDLLFVNEDEALQLTGTSEPVRAAEILRQHSASDVVIKLGPQGSYMRSSDDEFCTPGFRVACVDTTGAGDCFAGGFIAALQNDFDHRDAARFANAAGALNVQKLGAVNGVLNFSETVEWLNRNLTAPG